MQPTCSACGGPQREDATGDDSFYEHTPTCRIGMRLVLTQRLADFRKLMATGSLGTPGATAVRKLGRLELQLGDRRAWHALSEEERALVNQEMDDLERDLRNLSPRDLGSIARVTAPTGPESAEESWNAGTDMIRQMLGQAVFTGRPAPAVAPNGEPYDHDCPFRSMLRDVFAMLDVPQEENGNYHAPEAYARLVEAANVWRRSTGRPELEA